MFTTARTPVRDTLTAVAATIICSAVSLAALDSPAHAATTSGFVRTVERQLNDGLALTGDSGVATVAVRIDSEGRVMSAGLIGSTGFPELDRDALQTAKTVEYPRGGRSRNVAVVLTFGKAKAPAKSESAALVNRYVDAHGNALADRTLTPNAG